MRNARLLSILQLVLRFKRETKLLLSSNDQKANVFAIFIISFQQMDS